MYARYLGDYTRYIYTFNAQQKGKLDRGMKLWDLKWQHTHEGGQHVASGYSVVRAGIGQHAQLQRPLPAADRFPAFVSCWSVWPYRCGKIFVLARFRNTAPSSQLADSYTHTARLLKSAPKSVERNGVSSCGIEF